VQQVHLAGRQLGGEQDGPASPGVVLIDDVPDDQAFLVGFGHHLRGDVPDISYPHDPPLFLNYRRTRTRTLWPGNVLFDPIDEKGVLQHFRDRPISP
jgi:hypothetical protein